MVGRGADFHYQMESVEIGNQSGKELSNVR
jgi:hypothetical protein